MGLVTSPMFTCHMFIPFLYVFYFTWSHWGQGVVSWASTSQIHHKEMDKVPSQYLPSIPQFHSDSSKPIFLQFSQHRKWSAHSQCSRSCDWDFPKECNCDVPKWLIQNVPSFPVSLTFPYNVLKVFSNFTKSSPLWVKFQRHSEFAT